MKMDRPQPQTQIANVKFNTGPLPKKNSITRRDCFDFKILIEIQFNRKSQMLFNKTTLSTAKNVSRIKRRR